MGCKTKKRRACKRTSYNELLNEKIKIIDIDQSKLKESGFVQYFYHCPYSHLPIRDVYDLEKAEPHIEIGAENYIYDCYQNNIKEFANNNRKYLFLITTCQNKKLIQKYNKKYGSRYVHQFIVGYIKKEQKLELPDRIGIKGTTYIFSFEKSIRVRDIFYKNFAQSENKGRTLSLVRNYKVSTSKTKRILDGLPKPSNNIINKCIKEIERLDKNNITCHIDECPPKIKDMCRRRI